MANEWIIYYGVKIPKWLLKTKEEQGLAKGFVYCVFENNLGEEWGDIYVPYQRAKLKLYFKVRYLKTRRGNSSFLLSRQGPVNIFTSPMKYELLNKNKFITIKNLSKCSCNAWLVQNQKNYIRLEKLSARHWHFFASLCWAF